MMVTGSTVWAMRSRRSAALRVEPSAKSQSKTAPAIAIDADAQKERYLAPTGEAGASNLSTWLWLAAAIPTVTFWTLLFGLAVLV